MQIKWENVPMIQWLKLDVIVPTDSVGCYFCSELAVMVKATLQCSNCANCGWGVLVSLSETPTVTGDGIHGKISSQFCRPVPWVWSYSD